MVLDEGCEGGHKGGARVCGQDEDISFMPTWAMDWDAVIPLLQVNIRLSL